MGMDKSRRCGVSYIDYLSCQAIFYIFCFGWGMQGGTKAFLLNNKGLCGGLCVCSGVAEMVSSGCFGQGFPAPLPLFGR